MDECDVTKSHSSHPRKLCSLTCPPMCVTHYLYNKDDAPFLRGVRISREGK